MPPKRRKAADVAGTPEPKRRSARSASKATAPVKEAPQPQTRQLAPKTPKAIKPASESASKKVATTSEKTNNSKDHDTSAGVTELTIKHDSIKNPIPCHQYTASSKPKAPIPTLIFTHGAGGTLSATAVVNFCTGYSTSSDVFAFQGSSNLVARTKGFHACIAHLDTKSQPLILGGRSMGARAAVIARTEILASKDRQRDVSLILVSYPLKGPKDDIRDKILLDLPASVRVLFIIGEKDAMCPLDLLDKMRKKMTAGSKLVVVKGADHGMHVKPAKEEKRVGEETGRLAAAWASGNGDEKDVYI